MSQRFKSKEERLQYWSEHSRRFAASSQTLKAYCAEQKISHHTFSYWRGAIKKENVGDSEKLPRSKFVPVNITATPRAEAPTNTRLPDAKWVADFVRHFLQGASL